MSKCLASVLAILILILQACTASKPQQHPASSALHVPGISKHTLMSGDLSRGYQVYRPNNAKEGAAVVFVLHGSRGSGEKMRALVGANFERLADQQGFLVVYPDGYENHWNDCRGSADYTANTENIDDIAFFSALVATVTKNQQASAERMFVTGLSNGGQMAYKLAMEAPTLFRGYAAVIASLPEDRNLDCRKSNTPVSMMIVNGSEDPINPYNGGVVSVAGNSSRGLVMSTRETALYWAGLAGNRRPPNVKRYPEIDGDQSTYIEEKNWQNGNGHRITLVTMHGSGHVFPVPNAELPPELTALIGKAARDIDGAELITRFFFTL